MKPSSMLVQRNLPRAYWQKLSSVHLWGILEQAAKQIESEKEKAKENMRQEMVEIAMEATRKIVGSKVDEDKDKELISSFIDEVKR